MNFFQHKLSLQTIALLWKNISHIKDRLMKALHLKIYFKASYFKSSKIWDLLFELLFHV
jgi:hypothetical protein